MAFKRKLSRGIGTSLTSVGAYTAPLATEVTIIGLAIANISTSAISVEASLYDGVNDTYLVKGATVVAGGTLVVVGGDQKVVLEPGDSVRVASSDASSVDVVLSILEV